MEEKYYMILEKDSNYIAYELDANMHIMSDEIIIKNITFPDKENEILGVDKGIVGWGQLNEHHLILTSAIEDIPDTLLEYLDNQKTHIKF